jgi:hypothetical protein
VGFCNGTCADIKWVSILALNDVTTARSGILYPIHVPLLIHRFNLDIHRTMIQMVCKLCNVCTESKHLCFVDPLLWMAPGQMAYHHVAIAACVVCFSMSFWFLIASFRLLCIVFVTKKRFGSTIYLGSYVMVC